MVTSRSPVTLYTPSTRKGTRSTLVTLLPRQPTARKAIARTSTRVAVRITVRTSFGCRGLHSIRTSGDRNRYATRPGRRVLAVTAVAAFDYRNCARARREGAYVVFRGHCGGTETSVEQPAGDRRLGRGSTRGKRNGRHESR